MVLAIETVAASLSMMSSVATSLAPSIVTCGSRAVNPVNVTITSSVASTKASLIVATLIVAVVLPAAIVTVPVSAVKSSPLVAEPPTE